MYSLCMIFNVILRANNITNNVSEFRRAAKHSQETVSDYIFKLLMYLCKTYVLYDD